MSGLSYSSLGHGLLTGKYYRHSPFHGTDLRGRTKLFEGAAFDAALVTLRRVEAIAAARGRTPAQVAIRWILDRLPDAVALTGFKRATQVEENCGACGWALDAEESGWLEDSEGNG